MKRIILLLVVAALTLAMIVPAYAAPTTQPPENFGGNETSTENRNNNSGTGNFGQCHRTGVVDGQESSEFNPSSQNTGAADCRQAGELGFSGTADCVPGQTAGAEGQLTFQPTQDESGLAFCL